MSKVLIIYSSTDGQTKLICDRIKKKSVNESEIKVISIQDVENENISTYKNLIIGASIRYGNYRKELFEFIDENINIIHSKKNAFFSVNVVARKAEKNSADTNPYIEKFLLKTSWKPKIIDVFAGKIEYPKYNLFDRSIIKFIMRMTNGPTDTSKTFEFTDWSKVEKFSKNL